MCPKQVPLINSRRVPILVNQQEFIMAEQVSETQDPSQPVRVIVWYDYI
jgi:hypothetical protein